MYPMVQMLQIPCQMNKNSLLHSQSIYDEVQSLFCVHAQPKFQAQGTCRVFDHALWSYAFWIQALFAIFLF
jgi:hypothetical protein